MSELAPVLEAASLRKSFPARRRTAELLRGQPAARLVAVDDVSLTLHARKTLALVGESGSGKSTLAKVIMRLIDADGGAVRFHGVDLLSSSGGDLKETRRRIQMIFQDPYSSLNPRLKIGDAITEPARIHGLVSQRGSAALARRLLEQVGLSASMAQRHPRALSGGQRQRVAIARALAVQPEVLIADEAVSALDVSIQAQILNLFMDLQRDLGLAVLFISHQLSLVRHIADEVAVMYLGRIVERGPAERVFAQPSHPYTVALLAAQPGRHRAAREQPALEGDVPSLLDIPEGCRFRTRCPLAQEVCANVDPPMVELAGGQRSWCHVLPSCRDRERAHLASPAAADFDVE